MWYDGPEPSAGITPTEDKNAPTPPVQREAMQPESVEEAIKAIDKIRNRRSDIFAERYRYNKNTSFGGKNYKSNVREELELDKEDAELSKQETALLAFLKSVEAAIEPKDRAVAGYVG